MNEKVLVEGKFSKINPIALVFALCCFFIALLLLIVCFVVAAAFGGDAGWAFRGFEYGYYGFFIGMALFIALGVLCLFKIKFQLTVTDGRVAGKTFFGKRVDLPISQVSVVGTGILHRVSIATSSGSISFYGVVNQQEVYSVISEVLLKRQEETRTATAQSTASTSTPDELKKYKELLDTGLITQEEYDAKKKQLLNL